MDDECILNIKIFAQFIVTLHIVHKIFNLILFLLIFQQIILQDTFSSEKIFQKIKNFALHS